MRRGYREKKKNQKKKNKEKTRLSPIYKRLLGRPGKHGELAASASPGQGFAPDRGIFDEAGDLDVVIRALAGLVVGGEPPAPHTTILSDSDGMVGTGRDVGGLDARDRGRVDEDTGPVALIANQIVVGKRVDLQAGLGAVETAPDEAFAGFGSRHGVMRATADLDDASTGERLDDGGVQDCRLGFAGALWDAGFAVVVQAPAVDFSGLVDGKGVEGARADVDDVLGEAKLAGLQGVELVTLEDAAAELVLFARTPGKDRAFVIDGQDMVVAAVDLLDLFQGGNQSRSGLDLLVWVEAQDPVVALKY